MSARVAAMGRACGAAALAALAVLALPRPATAQCTPDTLTATFEVVRTWPPEGGVLPANRPILVELEAAAVQAETPDQPIDVITPKSYKLDPLPAGWGYTFDTLRSDLADSKNRRFLPGPYAEWSPTQWDDAVTRHMLISLTPFDTDALGPGDLTPGKQYTFSMEVGPNAEPFVLTFTAGDPTPTTPDPSDAAWHAAVVDTSCQMVHLDCSSADDCSADCKLEGKLQRIRTTVDVSLSDVPLPDDEPVLIEYDLSKYGFIFRQLVLPGDDLSQVGAQLDVFRSAEKDDAEACVNLLLSVPGAGPTAVSEESCDIAEGAADLCAGGATADPDPGADAGGGTDAGGTDAGSADVVTPDAGSTADAGHLPGGPDASAPGADAGGTGDASSTAGDTFGGDTGPGIMGPQNGGVDHIVDDGGCGCDLAHRTGPRARDVLILLGFCVAGWLVLNRRAV